MRTTREFQLLAPATFTNTTEQFTTEIDASLYSEGVVLLAVTGASGTGPTLTLKLYTKSPDTGNWYYHSTLVSALDVSGAGATPIYNAYAISNLGKKIRVGYALGGTGPGVTFGLQLILKD